MKLAPTSARSEKSTAGYCTFSLGRSVDSAGDRVANPHYIADGRPACSIGETKREGTMECRNGESRTNPNAWSGDGE
jgi:hypothetical protein